MDSLHWANLNCEIKFNHTKKMYFGRYLWRLEYKIEGAYLITDTRANDISSYVLDQIEFEKYRTSYAYHYASYRTKRDWTLLDIPLLEKIRHIRNSNKDSIRFRIEGDHVQLFTETEDELKKFSEMIGCYNLVSLTYPRPGTEDALRNGSVYMSAKTTFKYKVMLKDGEYSRDVKRRLLTQLNANPDVKVPNQLHNMLRKDYSYMWNCYFYANDEGITTMLSLISPGIVGKIHPIEHHQ